jgi:hypothetical protein
MLLGMKGATNHLTPGQRIAYYRRRRGMSQTVLAELVSRTLELFQPYLMQRSTPPHFVSNGDGLAERDYSHVPDHHSSDEP